MCVHKQHKQEINSVTGGVCGGGVCGDGVCGGGVSGGGGVEVSLMIN